MDLNNAADLAVQLERLGISIWVEDDRIRYKAPQGSMTPELKQRLRDNKVQLLPLLSGRSDSWRETRLPPVTPCLPGQQPQLSYSQQRLWFLDQLLPGRPTYNMAYAYRLRGALHVAAFGRALCDIIRRHEVLRTEIVTVDGTPHSRVAHDVVMDLPLTDLSGYAEPDREVQASQVAASVARQPFDLSQAPLMRAHLLRLDATNHWLVVCLHHIVNDDWSFDLLWRELEVCYQARCSAAEPGLPELSLQYADFAAWQHDQINAGRLSRQLEYWKRQLGGHRPRIDLPTDRQRPVDKAYRGDVLNFVIPGNIVEPLRHLAQRQNATLFMVLTAALKTLLHRYTGQNDIIIGTAIAGRGQHEVESLIGFFINTLILRTDLAGDPSFRELVDRVREIALAAYSHQDVPFQCVIEAIQPERDRGRTPLVDITLVLHKAPEPRRLSGLRIEQLPVTTGTAKFDLTLELTETPDGLLSGFFEYDSDLFESATIDRLAGHFLALLNGVVANPDARISRLPLLTESEQHQLLVEWNETDVAFPADALLHELFEAQAARTPKAVAVEYEGRQLSYRDLNARSNQVAHHLASLGVGPEVMVGICVERSLEMVVGLLGILKAGGAYVPLDPEYPGSRLAFMLEDTGAPVLLTQARLRERLPAAYGGRVVALDADWGEIAREGEGDLQVAVNARNLAYVIYTSGSTGRPKGTCIEHRSVVRLVKNTNYIELGADEVFLQFAPISFDASTLELWGSLLNGAKLVVCPAGRVSLEELGRVIREEGVSTLWLTAALFHQMVDTQIETLRGVRQLLAGGETLSVPHVRRMLGVIGRGRLINGYGPTENTTFTCCHVMAAGSRIGHSVPIGRPISNTRVYVLDAHLQPVPVGVYGELYIGGDGLAREYLHQPQLTAEKFVADPFSAEAGARLYRTGDLVRYLADGTIEFLGRFDNQVKVRGFRVELDEIEATLVEHPNVRQAAVHLWTRKTDDVRIVACCVPAKGVALAPVSLRKHLRARLPEHMIPQHFLPIDEIPLTPNGKVDRQRLPIPVTAESPMARHEAPANPIEAAIAAIWTELLQPARAIGRNDKFFEMGGHSLLALQALRHIEKRLGVGLEFKTFYHALLQESVAEIATQIQSCRPSASKKKAAR